MIDLLQSFYKRYLLFGIIMIFIAVRVWGQHDWKEFNLKGKVVSVKEITYTGQLENGKLEKGYGKEIHLLEFDDSGRLKANINFDDKKNQKDAVKYEYSIEGRLAVQNEYEGKDLLRTKKFFYDATGNLVEEKYYKYGKDYDGNITYVYDSRGLLVEVNNNYSIFSSKNQKNYNDKKLLTEEKIFDTKTGKQMWLVRHYYDSTGFKTMIIRKNIENGVLLTTNYTFEPMNNIICEEYSIKKVCRDYDENGNLMVYLGDGVRETYEYTFDEKGNWITLVKTTNTGKLEEYEIVERKIEYQKQK
jgi:hypothetical protein